MRELLVNITVIVFWATLFDLLLPKGELEPFVRLVMSLFIIVTVLNPILHFLKNDSWLDSWVLTENLSADGESVMAGSDNFLAENEDLMLGEYKDKLEQQISGLVYLADGVKECRTEVELGAAARLGELGKIEKVTVYVNASAAEIEERVQRMICGYYDLKADLVEVRAE